jgi:aminobenzoyl-glutamate utilization protein B
VIAILAEIDALPGMSQAAVPERKPIPDQIAGHACGHHLLGSGSVAAAIAVKNWLQETGMKGQIRVYGTPAEEGGGGKVYLVRAGLFKDLDVTLYWHPSDANNASQDRNLANTSVKFRFRGQASHAAVAPDRGRSALDAVEAMNSWLIICASMFLRTYAFTT